MANNFQTVKITFELTMDNNSLSHMVNSLDVRTAEKTLKSGFNNGDEIIREYILQELIDTDLTLVSENLDLDVIMDNGIQSPQITNVDMDEK